MNQTKRITAPKANVITPYGVFNKPFVVGALYILTMERGYKPKCACGCGQPVKLSYAKKYEKSHWNKYIHGHYAKDPEGYNQSGGHHSKESKQYLSKLRIGKPSPRKGVHLTEETKDKIRKSKEGRHPTEETKQKIRKTIHELYKNPELRKKCAHPQVITDKHKETVKQFMLNAWQNPNFRKGLVGENANNWRGGLTFEPYGLEFNNQLKSIIYERDNYTCQNPNCVIPGKRLNAHHIDYIKQNNTEYNLITLCCKCHCTTNWNREYWTTFYQRIINQKYGKRETS